MNSSTRQEDSNKVAGTAQKLPPNGQGPECLSPWARISLGHHVSVLTLHGVDLLAMTRVHKHLLQKAGSNVRT